MTRTSLAHEAPVVAPDPVSMIAADGSWPEPYEWLRQDAEARGRLLAREGQYAAARTSHLRPVLEARLGSCLDEVLQAEMPPPHPQGGYWYLPVTRPGSHLPVLVRVRRDGPHGHEPTADAVLSGRLPHEVVLDLERALDGRASGVGSIMVSNCDRYVIWTEDPNGAERFQVHVQPLGGGEVLHTLAEAGPGVVLTQQGSHLLWTALDAANRPWQVWTARLDELDAPRLLLEENDPARRLRLHAATSGRFVLVERRSRVENSFALIDAHAPGPPVEIPQPAGASQCSMQHAVIAGQDALVAVATSPERPHGWLVTLGIPDGTVIPDGWSVHLEHEDGRQLGAPLVTADLILCPVRSGGSEQLLRTFTTEQDLSFEQLTLSTEATMSIVGAPEWDSDVVRVATTSWTRPRQVRSVDLAADKDDVLAALLPQDAEGRYLETTVHARAADGEEIPITVVRRADLDGPGPCLITGYGAYGNSPRPHTDPLLASLLDAGLTWAFAHVRGSGTKGPRWHTLATGLGKPVSFTDFLSCVDHLVEAGFARADAVVAQGGSAGGLLVGRALTLAPDKFAAVVLDAPFVDPFVTMLHPDLPLTVNDRGEWGDPIADAEIAACMRAYSPCHTVSEHADYPPVLMSTGAHDSRVSPVEPLKFAQHLRAAGGDVLVLPTSGGHAGGGSVQETLSVVLLEYLWLAEHLGLDLPEV